MRTVQLANLVAVVLSITGTSCVPWVENVAKWHGSPPDLTTLCTPDEEVLVLPVWYDAGPCNVRDPLELSVAELVELPQRLQPRYRLGLMGIDGHGPSHFRSIVGVLVITRDGLLVWSDGGATPVAYLTDDLLKGFRATFAHGSDLSLKALFEGRSPHLRDSSFWGTCGMKNVGLPLSSTDRQLVLSFLSGSITLDQEAGLKSGAMKHN